jgi:hypothetical protein
MGTLRPIERGTRQIPGVRTASRSQIFGCSQDREQGYLLRKQPKLCVMAWRCGTTRLPNHRTGAVAQTRSPDRFPDGSKGPFLLAH